ncbi:hypothetical protein GCM10027047_01460 [Rhodococcus aerolatus]
MSKDPYACNYDGCNRGRGTGHAIHRTSPKGQMFSGRCEEHLGRPVDPQVAVITDAIEDHNGVNRDQP